MHALGASQHADIGESAYACNAVNGLLDIVGAAVAAIAPDLKTKAPSLA